MIMHCVALSKLDEITLSIAYWPSSFYTILTHDTLTGCYASHNNDVQGSLVNHTCPESHISGFLIKYFLIRDVAALRTNDRFNNASWNTR